MHCASTSSPSGGLTSRTSRTAATMSLPPPGRCLSVVTRRGGCGTLLDAPQYGLHEANELQSPADHHGWLRRGVACNHGFYLLFRTGWRSTSSGAQSLNPHVRMYREGTFELCWPSGCRVQPTRRNSVTSSHGRPGTAAVSNVSCERCAYLASCGVGMVSEECVKITGFRAFA